MSLQGTVKRFNPTKGFGFITGADGTDIFLHQKSCTDGGIPKEGDVVMYDMTESPIKPGQMQAGNVTGGTGKGGGGGAHHGSCKSFNAEKGFGFIVGADGSDIFFHVKGMADGTTPQAGDALAYDLEPSRLKPDQLQAQNITGGTGWDAAKGGGKGGGKDAWGAKGGGDAWGGKGGAGPYGGGKGKW